MAFRRGRDRDRIAGTQDSNHSSGPHRPGIGRAHPAVKKPISAGARQGHQHVFCLKRGKVNPTLLLGMEVRAPVLSHDLHRGVEQHRRVRLKTGIEEPKQQLITGWSHSNAGVARRVGLPVDQEILRIVVNGAGPGGRAVQPVADRVVQVGVDLAVQQHELPDVAEPRIGNVSRSGILGDRAVQAHLHLDCRMRAAVIEVGARTQLRPGIGPGLPGPRLVGERAGTLAATAVGELDRNHHRLLPRYDQRNRNVQVVGQVHGQRGIVVRHHDNGSGHGNGSRAEGKAPHRYDPPVGHRLVDRAGTKRHGQPEGRPGSADANQQKRGSADNSCGSGIHVRLS